MFLYDTIGVGYAKSRPADDRIVNALISAIGLPAGSTLLDVGAGTGKYARALADRGYAVIAVEPSEIMRSQSIPHPQVHMIAAAAEHIPLADGSAHGAFVVLALHHFQDRAMALREMLRVVGDGPLVIFTFEPSALGRFWLADYFPRLGREIRSSFAELDDVAKEIASLTGRTARPIPFPLPRDLEDKFAAAGWSNPETYLDDNVRNGISSFALMLVNEVSEGLSRLSAELVSGVWDRKYGSLRHQTHLDVGYRFIVAEKPATDTAEPDSPSRTVPR
jgi:ubiquinone/menaquinone biosynthesis C-methylase UbiE